MFGNSYALAAIDLATLFQIVSTYAPYMQRLFGVTSVQLASLISILTVSVYVLILVEIEKTVIRKIRPDIQV